MIQVQDFIIHNRKNSVETKLIGQKWILFSNGFIENCDFNIITNSQALPFYHKDKIKGCQLILNKTILTKDEVAE